LEATNFIEVIYQRPTKSAGSLVRIQEAQILKEFPGLRRSYELIQTSLAILGLVDQVGQEGDRHGEELFNLLGHCLQFLAERDVSSLSLFRLHFLLRFLFQQGVLNLEGWMRPFLQVHLREHHQLPPEISRENEGWILDQLVNVEALVQNYRETGAAV
jgi:recombinational DNA repair protein (RecF pathway)